MKSSKNSYSGLLGYAILASSVDLLRVCEYSKLEKSSVIIEAAGLANVNIPSVIANIC